MSDNEQQRFEDLEEFYREDTINNIRFDLVDLINGWKQEAMMSDSDLLKNELNNSKMQLYNKLRQLLEDSIHVHIPDDFYEFEEEIIDDAYDDDNYDDFMFDDDEFW